MLYAESAAFYAKAERENAKVFLWFTKRHISAIGGLLALVAAAWVGAKVF